MPFKVFSLAILLPSILCGLFDRGSSSSSSSSWLRFGAPDCIEDCISAKSDAFLCTHGRSFSWCCQDVSRSECQESSKEEVECSKGADFHELMVYSYCPRNTEVCQTKGTVLYPMLNSTQDLWVEGKPQNDEVCWYELRVDAELVQAMAQLDDTGEMYFSIYINRINKYTVHMLQGKTRKDLKRKEADMKANTFYNFTISDGPSLFLLLIPQGNLTQSRFRMEYQLLHPDFDPAQDERERFIEELEPLDMMRYWNALVSFFGLLLVGFLIALAVASLLGVSKKSDKELWMAYQYRKRPNLNQYSNVKTTERIDTSHQRSFDEESKVRTQRKDRSRQYSNNYLETEEALHDVSRPKIKSNNYFKEAKRADQDEF